MRQWRSIRDRRGGSRGRPFARKYTAADIRLLADVDDAYGQMSGLATREVLRRQFEVFGEDGFERLAAVSNGQVYNLRALATYRAKRSLFATKYRDSNGRIRRKYLAGDVMTPYDRLRSLLDAGRFLKPGIDFALLDAVAAAETDLEAARRVQAERRELFLHIGDGARPPNRGGRTPGSPPSPTPRRVRNRESRIACIIG